MQDHHLNLEIKVQNKEWWNWRRDADGILFTDYLDLSQTEKSCTVESFSYVTTSNASRPCGLELMAHPPLSLELTPCANVFRKTNLTVVTWSWQQSTNSSIKTAQFFSNVTTPNALRLCGFELMVHLPYSPELTKCQCLRETNLTVMMRSWQQ